jgi:hypothetical protein
MVGVDDGDGPGVAVGLLLGVVRGEREKVIAQAFSAFLYDAVLQIWQNIEFNSMERDLFEHLVK